MTGSTKPRQPPIKPQIFEIIRAKGVFTARDLPEISDAVVAKAVTRLVTLGELFKFKDGRRTFYFGTVEARDAFAAAFLKPLPARAAVGTKKGPAFAANAKVVIPPHVRIQYAPTPLGRYEVTGPVIGGFMTDWHTKRGTRAAA